MRKKADPNDPVQIIEQGIHKIENAKDDSKTALLCKRALRDVMKGFHALLERLAEEKTASDRIGERFHRLYHDLQLGAWGYKWNNHLDPTDNIINFAEIAYQFMRIGRVKTTTLKAAVATGDDELILKVAKDMARELPDYEMPEEYREEALEPIRPYM